MIAELVGSALAGGATGLLGSLVSDVAGYFKDKEQNSHEERMAIHDIEVLKIEGSQQLQVAQSERERESALLDGQLAMKAEESFSDALEDDAKVLRSASKSDSRLLVIAAFIRTMVRPVLTLYLAGLTTAIWYQSHVILRNAGNTFWGSAQSLVIYGDIVNTITYLTSTSILFWFGQRKRSK